MQNPQLPSLDQDWSKFEKKENDGCHDPLG